MRRLPEEQSQRQGRINVEKRSCSNLIRVSYGQIEVDPKEIEMRLSRAFDAFFEEVMRIRGMPIESKLEQEALTK